ncbi:dihydrofolate reductase family protein [Streptomyces sp. NPDC002623]
MTAHPQVVLSCAMGFVDELHLVTAPFFIGDAKAPRFVGTGPFSHGPGRPLRLTETRAIGDLVHSHYLADSPTQGADSATTRRPRKASA